MRCPKCASENPPEYRFCGMCGTPLEKRSPAAEPGIAHPAGAVPAPPPPPERFPPAQRRPISGPSFLGLADEPSRDVDYLLEDEEPKRSYWRFYLLLVILLACAGLGWLEYSHQGKAWVAPWSKQPPTTPVQASQQTDQQNPPSPGTSSQPLANDATASNSQKQPATAANPPQAEDNSKAAENADNQSKANQSTPPAKEQAQPAANKSEPTETASAEPPKTETENASPSPDTTESAKPKSTTTAQPKPRTEPAVTQDDALVANAEKYLYGRGVPQNCDRALSSLRAAADRENVRARSLLGTMYATGHCVPRDLPNAYRWFALASRESTDNVWVQRNLEMIWREMTPQERALAMKRSQ